MQEQQTLGRRIQEARKAAGLSQESLGERLGVSRQAVSKWEADTSVPELENLIAMSRIFGVTIGALLGVEPEAAEEPSEDGAPEAPGAEAASSVPPGELTDRELAAVEAIVRKYLEAAGRPRWSQRKRLAVWCAAGAAVLAAVLGVRSGFSALERQLNQVQSRVEGIETGYSYQINNLSGKLSGLLESQSSLISGCQLRVTDFDLQEQLWYLTVSATPKEYTTDTVATFTARTNTGETSSAEARNEAGTFSAENWAVPMGTSPGGEVQVSVAFSDGGTVRTEALETLYESPADYRLEVEGGWERSWKNGSVHFGSLTLHISPNPDVSLALESVELAVFPNGEAEPLWSASLPEAADLWRRQGYVQMYLTAEEYMPAIPLEEGEELLAAAKITDDHGQSFWYLLEASRNEYGTLRSVPASTLKSACPNWQPGGYVSPRWPGP